jgi:hypothetical protein
MTGETPQTYANHAQIVPGFHRVVLGILAANLIVSIVAMVKSPGFFTAWSIVLALGLIGIAWYVRAFPLRAQDRVIRLEERLRLGQALPEPLRARIPELTPAQLVALRFAPDAELPSLVEETLRGNLSNPEIKKRIKIWKPDTFRV